MGCGNSSSTETGNSRVKSKKETYLAEDRADNQSSKSPTSSNRYNRSNSVRKAYTKSNIQTQ